MKQMENFISYWWQCLKLKVHRTAHSIHKTGCPIWDITLDTYLSPPKWVRFVGLFAACFESCLAVHILSTGLWEMVKCKCYWPTSIESSIVAVVVGSRYNNKTDSQHVGVLARWYIKWAIFTKFTESWWRKIKIIKLQKALCHTVTRETPKNSVAQIYVNIS
jgi:hypothetical protein